MDETHTLAAMRYVEMNPVRAGLCKQADEWPWSSARGNLGKKNDEIIDESVVHNIISDWRGFLFEEEKPDLIDSLRTQTSTGRPSGDDQFIDVLERKTGRRIRRCNPGPSPKR